VAFLRLPTQTITETPILLTTQQAPGGKFTRKKEDAIAALFTQRNIEEAAKAAGIGANTLLRWLKVPEFEAAYRAARREAFGQSIARLQQGTSAAATTLLKT
jgi:hypothetical protein